MNISPATRKALAPKKKKVVVKKKAIPGTVSQDAIVAAARARANATIAAAAKPIQQQGANLAQQQYGAGLGLAETLAPVSQRIQDIYKGASDATAQQGQGYSAALRSLLEGADASTQAQLAAQGLPSPGAAPSAEAADVLYGLGGRLPAANLTQQGAGYASAAAFLPATARMQAQMDRATTQRQTQQQLAELRAKYPDLYEQYLTDERNWKNAQFDNYVNYLNSQAAGSGSTARVRTYVGKDGTTYAVDPTTGQYVPTGSVTVPPSSNSPSAKAATARAKAIQKRDDDTVKQIQKVDVWLTKALQPKKIGTKTTSVGGISKSKPIYGGKTVTYRQAYNYVFNQLWLALKRYGYRKAEIRQMAQKVIDTHNLSPQSAGPPNPNAPADSPVGGIGPRPARG